MNPSSILIACLALVATVHLGQSGFLDSLVGDTLAQSKVILKEVAAMIKNGDGPVTILKETIAKHPEVINNIGLFQMACQVSSVQNMDYVGPACKFLQTHTATFKKLLAEYKDDAKAWINFISQGGFNKPVPAQ